MRSSQETAPLPSQQSLHQDVAHCCPDVPPHVIDELFTQLDTEYFTLFTVPQIAAHVQLLAAIDDAHPVQVRVVPRSATSAEMLLAAYDCFGEFSIITGAMAAYGLNIRDGQMFSYRCGPGRTPLWDTPQSGLIVDVFTVEYAAERPFDSTAQASFVTHLTTLLHLLRQGQLQEARARLHSQIIDTMRTAPQAFPAHLLLSVTNALLQAGCVATIRGMSEKVVIAEIETHTEAGL